jgi:predicted transposase/invertase (TIGR01784 family)
MNRLNPLNDYIFKRLMEETESLIVFLNSVLSAKDQQRLVSLEIIDNKELTGELISDKTSRLDVWAKTADGMQINIEVQLTNQHNMDKRTIFYWGKLFLDGIKQGEDYRNLVKVITVNILDFEYLKLDRFHTKYHLWEDEEKQYMLTDLIEIHFIELPKFERLAQKDFKGNPLHRWLKFLDKNTSEEELKELCEMDQVIKNAEAKLEYLSTDAKTIALYRAREAALHERANMIYSAKEEGREEGRTEGLVEGETKGILKGKLAMAKNFLLMGMAAETVAKAAELPIEKIIEIQKSLPS